MRQREANGYYPLWLSDQEVADEYKEKFVASYNAFFDAKDPNEKKQHLDEFRVYLTIMCDVVAYRYLVKYYSNLFHRLGITIEEYMDYKVERAYITIKDKKEKIDDPMSYIYMSFMLSSPRLIYDYGEKMGRCKLVREVLPYFKTQRLKYFFIDSKNTIEHVIFNFDNIDLDEDSEAIRSNIDKYSLAQYQKQENLESNDSGFSAVREYVGKLPFKIKKARNFLLSIFDTWKTTGEADFEVTKRKANLQVEFTLLDYVKYKYEHQEVDLSYDEYIDVLCVLNQLLKGRKEFNF